MKTYVRLYLAELFVEWEMFPTEFVKNMKHTFFVQ
jgi:hypothetical protein